MADSFTMMALGDYRFSLDTAAYDQLERTHAWRWATVERIGAKSAAQYLGEGDEAIRMSGAIYPHFRGGIGQVEKLRAQASTGAPLQLVDGKGLVWGFYVVTDVTERQTIFFGNGTPRRIEFEISLMAYGGDPDEIRQVLETPPDNLSPAGQAAAPQAPAPAGPAPGRSGGGRSRESLELEAQVSRENRPQTVYERAGY